MTKESYLLYLEQTVLAYPTKTRQHLFKLFMEKNILVKDSSITGQLDTNGIESINISGMNMDDALRTCIRTSDQAIKELETWEFVKDYKYSVLFTCERFDSIAAEVDKQERLQASEREYLFRALKDPVYYNDMQRSYLKFNIAYSAIHPNTRQELLLKYPILVVFHKSSKLIEFRYDVLRKVFVADQEQDSYISFIDSIRDYLARQYEATLTGLDLSYMISVAKQEQDIKLIAQSMKFNTGQYAQLEVGNNQEYMLPLIGELNTILLDYQDELKQVPVLKDALEQFMFEKEEMSDYPWIEVLWENDIKTRSIHVKFIFNYMDKDYGVIQHYYSNVLVGMERMNYVVEYIASNRNDIREEIE